MYFLNLRFAGAILLFFIGLKYSVKKRTPFNISFVLQGFLFSFLGIFGPQLLVIKGLSYTSTTNTALITSLIPVLTYFFLWLRNETKLNGINVFGIALSFLGIFILRDIRSYSFENQSMWGDLLVCSGAICAALYFTFVKKFLEHKNHYWCTFIFFIMAIIQIFPFTYDIKPYLIEHWNNAITVPLIISIIGGTYLTYVLSNWALDNVRGDTVSLFIYIQPIFTSILAYFILGEHIGIQKYFSFGCILLGMFLVLFVKTKAVKS